MSGSDHTQIDQRNLQSVDVEKIMRILHQIPILGGLAEAELYKIFSLLKQVNANKDDVIFTNDSQPTDIYIVLAGEVKIVVGTDTSSLEIIRFGVGQCFGETSVIGIQPHSGAAIATEESELLALSGATLLSLHETEPRLFGMLILNIAREACRRLYQTNKMLLNYALKEQDAF